MRLDEDLFERVQDEEDAPEQRIDERIAALVAPLTAERDQLLAEKEAVRAYVKRIDAQLARIERILKAAAAPHEKEAKPKPTGQTRTRPADWRFDRVFEVLAASDEAMTSSAVARALDWTKSTTDNTLYWLRLDGRIRNAGYAGSARLFASMPAEVEQEEEAAA